MESLKAKGEILDYGLPRLRTKSRNDEVVKSQVCKDGLLRFARNDAVVTFCHCEIPQGIVAIPRL